MNKQNEENFELDVKVRVGAFKLKEMPILCKVSTQFVLDDKWTYKYNSYRG